MKIFLWKLRFVSEYELRKSCDMRLKIIAQQHLSNLFWPVSFLLFTHGQISKSQDSSYVKRYLCPSELTQISFVSRYIPDWGRLRKEVEKGRKRNTHAGETTHDGPVICWTTHGHVVLHGHEVYSIVHLLVLSRGVPYRQRAVQLYDQSQLRATRIDITVKEKRREEGSRF